jgi:hypothetical protein
MRLTLAALAALSLTTACRFLTTEPTPPGPRATRLPPPPSSIEPEIHFQSDSTEAGPLIDR